MIKEPLSKGTLTCPLCLNPDCVYYHHDNKREYWRCPECELIHVPKDHHLSPKDEKSLYDLHINDPNDPGYRNFLQRFITPLLAEIKPLSETPQQLQGLDFGSGPGPTLSIMLNELGYPCHNYDLYYDKNDELLIQQNYDFVTCTEVVEHLAHPITEFNCLFSLLKPSSCLAIMTKRSDTLERFKTWHYIQDPTHICFYNETSFQWIADKFNTSVHFPEKDVIIFKKRHT